MLPARRLFHTSARRLQTVQLVQQVWHPPEKKGSVSQQQGQQQSGLSRPPIVFMHGLFGSKQNSRSISKILAKDLNTSVHVVDLRNHGDSPQNPTHNYTSMAQDIEAFIQENNLRQPILIGHSMGAKTAMAVALRRPYLVSSFIAVDNSPVTAPLGRSFTRYAEGMREIERAQVKSQKEADQILQQYEKSLPVRQFLLTNLVRDQETGKYNFRIPVSILSNALNEMAGFPFSMQDTVKFDRPALFIRGTRSTYVKDESRPLIEHFFPRYQMVDIDAGHWLISEKPEEFRDAVVRFLS